MKTDVDVSSSYMYHLRVIVCRDTLDVSSSYIITTNIYFSTSRTLGKEILNLYLNFIHDMHDIISLLKASKNYSKLKKLFTEILCTLKTSLISLQSIYFYQGSTNCWFFDSLSYEPLLLFPNDIPDVVIYLFQFPLHLIMSSQLWSIQQLFSIWPCLNTLIQTLIP